MKKIILLFSLFGMLISCAETKPCDVPTNGFIDGSDQTIMMGSQETVEVFKKIDAAWAARDYETLKAHIGDGTFFHDDGTVTNNGDSFVAKIESSYQSSIEKEEEWGWTTNFAFAVKPSASDDPEQTNTNGEWVNARFTGADGAVYEEWYQIANDKLIWWSSAKRETGFPPPPPVE